LQEDAKTERSKENTVEKGAQELCALPAEGEFLRGFTPLGNLGRWSAKIIRNPKMDDVPESRAELQQSQQGRSARVKCQVSDGRE